MDEAELFAGKVIFWLFVAPTLVIIGIASVINFFAGGTHGGMGKNFSGMPMVSIEHKTRSSKSKKVTKKKSKSSNIPVINDYPDKYELKD